jgi:hypothetical protein
MIYLASPYSHPDPAAREERFHAACRAAAALLRAGHAVFSPIARSHALARHGLPADWTFWQRYDRDLLARCDAVVVLTLDGWETSVGVREEIRIARELGKPVRYLAPELARVSPTLAYVASGGAIHTKDMTLQLGHLALGLTADVITAVTCDEHAIADNHRAGGTSAGQFRFPKKVLHRAPGDGQFFGIAETLPAGTAKLRPSRGLHGFRCLTVRGLPTKHVRHHDHRGRF